MRVPKDYNMSEGALQVIMSGGDYSNPIMQILGSKRINAGGGDKERIRILLSDGKNTISFAMVTTQINDKMGPKGIENFSVIQIDKYVTSIINNSGKGEARVLLILDMHIVASGSEITEKIGNPVPLSDAGSKGSNSSTPSTSSTGTNVQNGTNGHSSSTTYKPQVNVSMNENSENLSLGMTHPISSLTPYQNKWIIKARVTNKSQIRTWSNSKGEGKLFSFDLVDESGEIRATAFRDSVDKYYDFLEIDKVYYLSKCQLKPANKQYSTLKNDYELTLTGETIIQECQDADSSEIPQVQYNFVSIDKIPVREVNSLIDVVAVVKSVTDVQTIQARTTGRELKKREVTIVDQSKTAIALTLWGAEAENFDGTNNPVIVLKGARIVEFMGGKSLGTVSGTSIKINPEMKECYRIRGWYDSEGGLDDVTNISARTGSGSFQTNWMTFKDMKDQKLGHSDKGDYFQVVGTILLFKSDNMIYKACPTEECNKKIVDMENGMYRCEKCNREYPNFKYRLLGSMNVGDHTGNQWISMFNSEAEKILGMTAEQVGQAIENDPDAAAKIVDRAHFKEYLLRCRVKLETYNDETRLKAVCIKVEPVNYEDYNAFVMEKIKEMTN